MLGSTLRLVRRKTSAIHNPEKSDSPNSPELHSSGSPSPAIDSGSPIEVPDSILAFHSPNSPEPHSSGSPSPAIILDSGSPNDSEVPESILAFRSITTLLSNLQKAGKIYSTPSHSLDRNDRQQLRILAALACILVRKHEVVTVVAIQPQGGQQGGQQGGPGIQPIACSLQNEVQPKPPQMQKDTKPKPRWSLATTGNYRRDNHQLNGSLGVRKQGTPIVPKDTTHHPSTSFRESYITCDAYVQFKTIKLEPFSCLI
jgi:hypothetical protein